MTTFVICVGSSLLSKTTDVTLAKDKAVDKFTQTSKKDKDTK